MVPAIFISFQMTGNLLPQLGFGSTGADGVYLLDKLDGLHRELGFHEYTSGSKSVVDVFFITAALMVGTAGLPHVIVRFFTVNKVSDARKSAGWALLFIAILYTTAPAIAVFARTNLIETVSNQKYEELPDWFHTWETTGLLQFEDKNADGLVQYVADAAVNELQVDKDIMVLANPEIANLPNWVIGLIAAGALAAALSTAAGLLLVISASVSHDLIKKMIRPAISEKGELIAARFVGLSCRHIGGVFWYPSARICCRYRRPRFWIGSRFLFSGHRLGHILQTNEQRGCRSWNGCGSAVDALLHDPIQVRLVWRWNSSSLVVRNIARRIWNLCHASKFCGIFSDLKIHTRTSKRSARNCRKHSNSIWSRSCSRPLIRLLCNSLTSSEQRR
jgi:hypothetical protein